MTITYLEAIREAQEKALRDDPRVYIYGQDVATFGGSFKATKNLAKEFPGRILDAPISEDAMVGSAIGYMLGGAVLLESVFGWPGLGNPGNGRPRLQRRIAAVEPHIGPVDGIAGSARASAIMHIGVAARRL